MVYVLGFNFDDVWFDVLVFSMFIIVLVEFFMLMRVFVVVLLLLGRVMVMLRVFSALLLVVFSIEVMLFRFRVMTKSCR